MSAKTKWLPFILTAFVALGAYAALLSGQDPVTEASQAKGAKETLGFWTEIYREVDNLHFSSVSTARDLVEGTFAREGIYSPTLWKFSMNKLEIGPDRKGVFPTKTYTFKDSVEPANGPIDLCHDGPAPAKETDRAIYLRADDLLIICFNEGGGPRPERFTSSKDPKAVLVILRRGRLDPGGDEWLGRKYRLPD